MLTPAQYQQWCLHLHLSPQASEAVTRVRSSPPVRRVGSRANNVSGTYASRKMGYAIQFESHKVALWAVYTMEYDPQVLECYDQPTTLQLHYQATSGRAVTVSHSPDFLVLPQDGAWLEEWKQEYKLLELAITQPHRYQRDERGTWRCPQAFQGALHALLQQIPLDMDIQDLKASTGGHRMSQAGSSGLVRVARSSWSDDRLFL